jgi:predicted nucleic acid-binding protein
VKLLQTLIQGIGPSCRGQQNHLVRGSDGTEISTAFRIEDEPRIGSWNALIVASALRNDATRILSEDLNPGQAIAGVQIQNPFLNS